ncbi:MAG: LptE family protein [Kiritimatiellia bacterium]
MKRRISPVLRPGAAFILAALLCGCAGYRLGSSLPPGIRSVYVPAFINESGEPLLETGTTAAVIEELHRDGTLEIKSSSEADAVLKVTLADYRLVPLRYEDERPKTAEEYRAVITARMNLKNRKTGRLLYDTSVSGETTFTVSGDLRSAKRAALPGAAEDLARKIVDKTVEYW